MYFNIESYYFNQIPEACFWLDSEGMVAKAFNLFHNGKEVVSYEVIYDSIPINYMIPYSSYQAGDKFVLGTQYNWGG